MEEEDEIVQLDFKLEHFILGILKTFSFPSHQTLYSAILLKSFDHLESG